MGYLFDTQMSQFISPDMMGKSAGTWTPTLATNTVGAVRTAGAATFNLFVPIVVPGNAAGLKGSRLKSIDLFWKNATADLNSVTTVELEKVTLPANGSAVTAAAVTTTLDSNNDTTAKRITQAAHKMTVSVTVPEWVAAGTVYWLYVTFDCAATSALTLWGAQANFDLRA